MPARPENGGIPTPRLMVNCRHCRAPVDLTGLPAGGLTVCERCGGWLTETGQAVEAPVSDAELENMTRRFIPRSVHRGLDKGTGTR